jgi:hypothetical protein
LEIETKKTLQIFLAILIQTTHPHTLTYGTHTYRFLSSPPFPPIHTLPLGLTSFRPLQFLRVGETPLLFVLLEKCHWKFSTLTSLPYSMSDADLGPLVGTCSRIQTKMPSSTSRACAVVPVRHSGRAWPRGRAPPQESSGVALPIALPPSLVIVGAALGLDRRARLRWACWS